MPTDFITVLAQIDRRVEPVPAALRRWIAALKTISWVAETEGGLTLTPAGRAALEDARKGRRWADKDSLAA